MKSVVFFLLLLLPACAARTIEPLSWPFAQPDIPFTGVLHTLQGDMPIQGMLEHTGNEFRYAGITQNGFLLGIGILHSDSDDITLLKTAPSAESALRRIGNALRLLLSCPKENDASDQYPWQALDNVHSFQDNMMTLTLTLPIASPCRTLK